MAHRPRTQDPDEPLAAEQAAPVRRAGAMDPWDRPRSTPTTPFDDRVAPASPFPPIADYAFLSDCHTAALVAPDGTVEWLCPPRFDAPSVFAAVLDRSAGGFRLGPTGMGVPAGRRYEPGTNVLETTWQTATGWAVVRDALIFGRWREREAGSATAHTRPPADHDAYHVLVRTIECFHGSVQMELVCEPMFDYGRTAATWSAVGGRPPGPGRRGRGSAPAAALGPARRHRGRHGPRASSPREGGAALLRAVVVAPARRPADLRGGARRASS